MYRRICIPARNVRTLKIPPGSSTGYNFQSNLIAHTRHITVDWALNWIVFARLISEMKLLETLR